MPLRLTLLEHVLAHFNLLPVPLFDIPLAPGSQSTGDRVRNGYFRCTERASVYSGGAGGRLHCDPQGLLLFLQLLVSAGYLRHRGGHYANTRIAQRWLTSASPDSVAPYIIHRPDIVAIWDHLPEVVRENKQAIRMPYA